MARPTGLTGSCAASPSASVGSLRSPRIEPVTPAFGVRYFDFKLLKLLILTGGTSIAIAVLCTTVQHSVTQISHGLNCPGNVYTRLGKNALIFQETPKSVALTNTPKVEP
jgi:hypothetical protein